MKNLFKLRQLTIVACFVAFCICASCLGQTNAANSEGLKYQAIQFDKDIRLKIQEDRLAEIAAIAQDSRLEIEKDYSYQMEQLQLWAENYAQTINLPAKTLWAEILKSYGYLSYTDSYLRQEYVLMNNANIFDALPYYSNTEQNKFRQMLCQLLSLTSDGVTPDFLYDQYAFEQGRQPTRVRGIFKIEDITEIQRLFAFMKEFDGRLGDIERQKQQQLAEIGTWENSQKENIEYIINDIQAPAQKSLAGVVAAICIEGKEAQCMIEGVEELILKAGDKINNITIEKILPETVEFKKGWKTWTQKIGESANQAWL